jgi:hypothetical protein
VRDQNNPKFGGKFLDWRIQFWGETKREKANIKAKPLMPPFTGDEEEQLLSQTQSDGEGHNTNPGDVTEEVVEEEKEKEEDPASPPAQPPADQSTSDSKVIVDKDPTVPQKLGQDKDNLPVTNSHHENVDTLHTESSAFEPDSEEEVASTVSRSLYAFVGIIGVGGLIAGYLTRHKWDGRGQYASVRGGGGGSSSGGGARHSGGRNFENDDDDIDLLPRGVRPGRADSALTDYEDDEDVVDGEEETRKQQQRKGQEMESRSNRQERQRQRTTSAGRDEESGECEEGSDTDNEDFLVQSVRGGGRGGGGQGDSLKGKTTLGGSQLMKQATSSPATLLVDHA